MQIDLPAASVKHWTQTFDWAKVTRLPATVKNEADFWKVVEQRKQELETLPHQTEPNRMSRYQKVGDNAALLLYRDSEYSKSAHLLQRYLWLGQWGYEFRTDAMREEVSGDLSDFIPVFERIKPRDPGVVVSQGFCIDGAQVVGETGTISAGPSMEVAGWKNTFLWVGASEGATNPAQESSELDADLDREREAVREVAKEIPGATSAPEYPKDFDVLRQRDRALNGFNGREVVWRKQLNNGAELYTFRWKAASGSGQSDLMIGMDIGDEAGPVPGAPKDDQLFSLWDAVLESLKTTSSATR